MKFDTVIIGGGLSGLTAGITLTRAGHKTAIVSTGQSALHFCSGSMELLGYDADHFPVDNPIEAIASLPPTHPYSVMGHDNVARMVKEVKPLFEDCGIGVRGSEERNHWRLTPVGQLKPAWLTIEDYLTLDDANRFPWKKVAVVNIDGFLDFFPRFLMMGLSHLGVESVTDSVSVPAIEHQRRSTTEMRATNIARVLNSDAVDQLAARLNAIDPTAEAILLPAIAGFDDFRAAQRLRERVKRPLRCIATMGTSVPGVRAQIMMQKYFRQTGGAFMLGDTVVHGSYDASGTRLQSVETANFGSDLLEADHFIFAAGSFFSHGLNSTPAGIFEPVLGLDVDAPTDRSTWFDKDIFKPQPYMKFGITVDSTFHALRSGKRVENVIVAGASLPGADPLREGSGAGIALTSALFAAKSILNESK